MYFQLSFKWVAAVAMETIKRRLTRTQLYGPDTTVRQRHSYTDDIFLELCDSENYFQSKIILSSTQVAQHTVHECNNHTLTAHTYGRRL